MIIVYSAYSSELFRECCQATTLFFTSAPLTLLSCFGRTAHFFKVQLAKKTQLLLMHSYYMAYSCINCQILLHRIILTCSFSSANPTAILWVLNVRTPWQGQTSYHIIIIYTIYLVIFCDHFIFALKQFLAFEILLYPTP